MDTFATPRLKATKLAREDLLDLVQLHLDSDVSRFLGGVRTPSATATYLETNLRHWVDHGLGLWTLRTGDGTFIGRAGLRHVELEGVLELELAYTFVRSAWRQGFATPSFTMKFAGFSDVSVECPVRGARTSRSAHGWEQRQDADAVGVTPDLRRSALR